MAKAYYTSSEAVAMCLKPDVPLYTAGGMAPPSHYAFGTGNQRSSVSHEPLLRPAALRERQRQWPGAATSSVDYEPLLRPSTALRAAQSARTQRHRRPAPFGADRPRTMGTQTGRVPAASWTTSEVQRQRRVITGRPAMRPPAPLNHSPAARRSYGAVDRRGDIGWGIMSARTAATFRQPYGAHYGRVATNGLASYREPKMARYEVVVHVGGTAGSASSANLFVRIKGGRRGGAPGRYRLGGDNMVQMDDGRRVRFVADSKHVFHLRAANVPNVTSIVLETDALSEEDAIFVRTVELHHMDTHALYAFDCDEWLSLYHSDCHISREMFVAPVVARHETTEYDVKVVTGAKFGAGTDANVFVTLYGSNGATPRLQLYTPKGRRANFERGDTDEFTLRTRDVGNLSRIRLEHDNTGRAPGWFVDHVLVTNRRTNVPTMFVCDRWLARDEDDGRCCRDFTAGAARGKKSETVRNYAIAVFTGTKRGAGTDANVYVTLFGARGDTAELQLRGRGNLFERGDRNDFTFELPYLGPVHKLRIRHDNSGIGPGWYLDKVEVNDGKEVYSFPCDRWLSKTEDDGALSRDLVAANATPGRGGGRGAASLIAYAVTVRTGDRRHAGTNANVYLLMHGGKKDTAANSGKLMLEGGEFERNSVDTFNLEVAGLYSPMSHITIGHDGSGFGAGWFLHSVSIKCGTTGIEQHFNCNRWLAADEEDGAIERDLHEDRARRTNSAKEMPWDIVVNTGDVPNAGTNANVFVTVYGQHGERTDRLALSNESDKWERGATDRLAIDMAQLAPPLTKLRVEHDNAGAAAGWFLRSMELHNRLSKDKYEFACDRWLATDEDDGSLVRELPASGKSVRRPLALLKYKVDVYTSDKFGAGTDADVFCCIGGQNGDTGDRPLKNSSNHRNKWERNQMDSFVVEAVDLGRLTSLRIGHNDKGVGAGWHLHKVVVHEPDGSAATFVCDRWLARDEDDGAIVRELSAAGNERGGRPMSRMDSAGSRAPDLLTTCTYKLSVRTSDVKYASTGANVHVELVGDGARTGRIELDRADNNDKPFQKGRTDVFSVEANDIGKLRQLHIGHDGSGSGSGWHLHSVVVSVPHTGDQYTLPCDRWLATDEADGKTLLVLEPASVDQAQRECPYEITVATSDVKNAGSGANVTLQIYGVDASKKTDVLPLRNCSDNFQRAQVDVFKVNALDVDSIGKIRVANEGTGRSDGWHLHYVKIRKPKTAARRSKARGKATGSAKGRSVSRGSNYANRTPPWQSDLNRSRSYSRPSTSHQRGRGRGRRATNARSSDESPSYSSHSDDDSSDSASSATARSVFDNARRSSESPSARSDGAGSAWSVLRSS